MSTGYNRSDVEAATAAGAVAGLAGPGRTVCPVVRQSSQTQQAQALLPDVEDIAIAEMRTRAGKPAERHSAAADDHTRTARAAARMENLVLLEEAVEAHCCHRTAAEGSHHDCRMGADRAHAGAAAAAAGSSAEVRDSDYRPIGACEAPDCYDHTDSVDRLALAWLVPVRLAGCYETETTLLSVKSSPKSSSHDHIAAMTHVSGISLTSQS